MAKTNKTYENSRITCIVLCAGRGSRFIPLSLEKQKTMIEVNGQPILGHVIDYWKKYTDDFIFIVNYKKEGVVEYVKERKDIKTRIIEQPELRGIANAISYADNMVSQNFIVVLGDCICNGDFKLPKDMEMGVGVWKTKNPDDIKRSYSIETDNEKVVRVVEKPKELPNDNCGMGFYFFNKDVFDYIKITKPSALRNEIEITDVIQKMIDGNEKISPVFFNGKYLNMTTTDDLSRAEKILRRRIHTKTVVRKNKRILKKVK